MLSNVDFSDETLSFPFDGSSDEFFGEQTIFSDTISDFEMSNILGDINFDNLNLPDEILVENILDTSDSDSGISSTLTSINLFFTFCDALRSPF